MPNDWFKPIARTFDPGQGGAMPDWAAQQQKKPGQSFMGGSAITDLSGFGGDVNAFNKAQVDANLQNFNTRHPGRPNMPGAPGPGGITASAPPPMEGPQMGPGAPAPMSGSPSMPMPSTPVAWPGGSGHGAGGGMGGGPMPSPAVQRFQARQAGGMNVMQQKAMNAPSVGFAGGAPGTGWNVNNPSGGGGRGGGFASLTRR